jgi:hypothetical protein
LVSAAVAAAVVIAVTSAGHKRPAPTVCLYTRTGISGLQQSATLLGLDSPRCAVIFDRTAPDWQAWERPWFVGNRIQNDDWARWGRQPGRRLVITLGLIPASALHEDWRRLGATGAYAGYARTLARNLVAAGLGQAVIRLSNEPNGTWFPDNLGPTAADRAEWVQFWRRTASTMLSVRGARFQFDWSVANGTGSVPLSAYYPGDRWVSFIGDDIYDAGFRAPGGQRWTRLATMNGGVDAVRAFARAHDKPFSVPEWGLNPPPLGGGDDPAFVRAIAALSHTRGFGYQGYFFAGASQILEKSPASLAAYRKAFDGEH